MVVTVTGHQEEDAAAPPPESSPTWDSFAAAALRDLTTTTITDQGTSNIQPWCPASPNTIRDAGEALFLLLVRRAMRQLGGAFKPSHHSES
jgi:hypothetical protein